jgi:RND family efflux transporter MFP subunit
MFKPADSRAGVAVPLVVALVVAAVAALGIYYFSRPVASVMAVKSDVAVNAVPGSVTVYAEYQMPLTSEIGGRVLKSRLDPGLAVKEGEFLAQIDPGDLDLEIERIESEYNAHKSRVAVGSAIKLDVDSAKEQLASTERLLSLGQASESQVIGQKRLVRAAEQRLELEAVANKLATDSYENTLKVKRRQRQKMTILAPFDGVISTVEARPGALVGGNAPLATLISTGRTVEAKISEENFAGLMVGQKASVRFLGYGAQLYGASITKILPTADPQTQRYIIHLNVDLPLEKLKPGLTGEVTIKIDERKSDTIVPRRALRNNQLLVVSGGRVEVRNVKVGYVALNEAEILSGVKKGELVIVDELDQFQPGDRVRTDVVAWPEAGK